MPKDDSDRGDSTEHIKRVQTILAVYQGSSPCVVELVERHGGSQVIGGLIRAVFSCALIEKALSIISPIGSLKEWRERTFATAFYGRLTVL